MPTLTEEELEILRTAAAPIPPRRRSYFFEEVDARLVGRTAGPGLIARICAEVQPKYLNAPPIAEPPTVRPARTQPPRGAWRRRA
jgi:hypothetical protein